MFDLIVCMKNFGRKEEVRERRIKGGMKQGRKKGRSRRKGIKRGEKRGIRRCIEGRKSQYFK